MGDTVLAWWFAPKDKRLGYGDGREVVEGETLTVGGPLELCQWGLHGSERLIDALSYASSSILCRVEIGGHYLKGPDGRLCGTSRKTIWMRDVAPVLHEFSCRVAEDACRAAGVTDGRCYSAIEAKRSWLRGEITDEQLCASLDSARDAARDASWAAARAATRDAVRAATMAEASAATRAAARDAAWDAARDASWAAARAGAWAAALAAQNELLTSMVEEMLLRRYLVATANLRYLVATASLLPDCTTPGRDGGGSCR